MSAEKTCPSCGTEYPANERFCPRDGTALRTLAATADLVGSVVGERYHVLSKLGEGGMGQVYLAEHVKMRRKSALKVMRREMAADADAVSRFNREAGNASRINHPNVAAIYDFGETTDGLTFLAMELVEGESLSSLLEQHGALHPMRAAEIIRQVGEGLQAAHDLGIVHRDLKPDNIMIAKTREGADLVKVVDFGIAKAAGGEGQTVTRTGLTVGTPQYMSPEQIAGDPITGASDVYSMALMAFNLFTGVLPFRSTSMQEAMMMRLTEDPIALSDAKPGTAWSGEVQVVMQRGLERVPADRYRSAADFGRDLYSTVEQMSSDVSGATLLHGSSVARSRVTGRARSPNVRPARNRTVIALMIGAAAAAVGIAAIGTRTLIAPRSVSRIPPPTRGFDAIAIAAGDYVIGNDSGPALARPRHSVHVNAFALDRTEVTVAAYLAFASATRAPLPWSGTTPAGALPVTRVPWADAANYCAWRHVNGGRLPTEFEWEAAARGLSARPYPYGASADAAAANTASARRGGPVPVGSFPRGATPEGLQDMSGNVWEWTSSPLVAYAGSRPPADSMSQYRVIRGGAFDTSDEIASASTRGYLKVSSLASQLPNTGFRCAMSSEKSLP